MILSLIIFIVGALMIIPGAIIMHKTSNSWSLSWLWEIGLMLLVIGIIAFFITGILMIVVPISCQQEFDLFINQKEYIENYNLITEYDIAAIANKKIELNEWLYRVQYTKEHYPICSFFGDEILELEPIK